MFVLDSEAILEQVVLNKAQHWKRFCNTDPRTPHKGDDERKAIFLVLRAATSHE